MFSVARILLTLAFLVWSLLLLGGSGLVGWIGDGLAGLLTQVHLSWLANAAAGLGKALILIVWIVSAMIFAVFFAITGRIATAAKEAARAPSTYQQRQGGGDATVTLERGKDGSYS